jgi:hypothetical protein
MCRVRASDANKKECYEIILSSDCLYIYSDAEV